jgi:hypothetical protein
MRFDRRPPVPGDVGLCCRQLGYVALVAAVAADEPREGAASETVRRNSIDLVLRSESAQRRQSGGASCRGMSPP